ncbi:MAG: HD-GYP domain-containing protein [Vicinamibacterales bacterium]
MASVGPATLYTLVSLDQEAASATRAALSALALIAVGALVLAGLGSWWLARTLSGPVDRLSTTLATMAATGQFDAALAPTGTSREVDTLIRAFNEMMSAIARADAATEASYLGTIRALAAALDARDPYTSGHSERVSAISVEMGRTMGLADSDLEVLRLGALLHDIGKIGVPDHILRKPAPLTTDELECIKTHPLIGAKIVRSIPLLAQHLPIVELHHERPDGQGYPFGLSGDAIPVVARITHVADAYDAMTSARAYRPARPSHEAVAELTRHQGTGFDPDAVTALIAALPALSGVPSSLEANVFQWSWPSRARSLAS